MVELIATFTGKLIPVGLGIYFAFIHPSIIKKRVADGTLTDKEAARLKWFRPLGFGLIVIGSLLIVVKFI